MRHTKSHTRNRRSHHKAEAATLSRDTNTGTTHLRHRVCMETGKYRGKQILDVSKAVAKKHDKATKKAEQAEK